MIENACILCQQGNVAGVFFVSQLGTKGFIFSVTLSLNNKQCVIIVPHA